MLWCFVDFSHGFLQVMDMNSLFVISNEQFIKLSYFFICGRGGHSIPTKLPSERSRQLLLSMHTSSECEKTRTTCHMVDC